MLVSLQRRLVFLAAPKTGTTAVEDALAPHCEISFQKDPVIKHMTYRRYRQAVLPMLEALGAGGAETICVVREPESWLRSWWRYRRRPALDGRPKSTRGVSFAAFVEDWLSEAPSPRAAVGRASRFTAAPPGAPPIDHLFRYERLDLLAGLLSERFGRRFAFPRVNVSPPEADEALPPALRARLEREAAAEFELYHGLD